MTSMSWRPSRRSVLIAGSVAAAAVASGCRAVGDVLGDDPKREPENDSGKSDDRLIDEALADQERVLAQCLATRAEHRTLRKTLAVLIDHHRTHVKTLGGTPSSRGARRAAVPSRADRAVERIRKLELEAAGQRTADAGRARSGELARVLAAIAASQNQHAYLLDQARSS